MGSRLNLHNILLKIVNNVYYQPPKSVLMKYPAIRYSLNKIDIRHANNCKYKANRSYDVTLIDYDPDNKYIEKILALPYCEFDRHYVSDNLHHYVFRLYY